MRVFINIFNFEIDIFDKDINIFNLFIDKVKFYATIQTNYSLE